MTWDRTAAAAALADVLEVGTGDLVAVFEGPPPTLNPPALVIMRPSVAFSTPTFGIDEATWSIMAAVGVGQDDALDDLLAAARQAVIAEPTLGGAVQLCRPTELRPRGIINVAGGDYLTEELILETRM